MLRPELVKAFVQHKRYELAKEHQAKKKAEKDAATEKEAGKEAEAGKKAAGEAGATEGKEASAGEEKGGDEKLDLSQFEAFPLLVGCPPPTDHEPVWWRCCSIPMRSPRTPSPTTQPLSRRTRRW